MLTADFEEKLKKVEEERHTAEMYSGRSPLIIGIVVMETNACHRIKIYT